jgi:hypothetical protein
MLVLPYLSPIFAKETSHLYGNPQIKTSPHHFEHLHNYAAIKHTNQSYVGDGQSAICLCLSPYQRRVNNGHLHIYSYDTQVHAWRENALLFNLKLCLCPITIY